MRGAESGVETVGTREHLLIEKPPGSSWATLQRSSNRAPRGCARHGHERQPPGRAGPPRPPRPYLGLVRAEVKKEVDHQLHQPPLGHCRHKAVSVRELFSSAHPGTAPARPSAPDAAPTGSPLPFLGPRMPSSAAISAGCRDSACNSFSLYRISTPGSSRTKTRPPSRPPSSQKPQPAPQKSQGTTSEVPTGLLRLRVVGLVAWP